MKGWSFLIFCLTLNFASEVLGIPSNNYTARRISYQKTGDSYDNGYQQGYGYSKSKSSESSESSESKSCEKQECIAPTDLAKLYVANGVVGDDGYYQREPEAICPCAQGSQQFFKPSMYSTASSSYEDNQLAFELYADTDVCENMCIRDKDGNFWKPTDTTADVILVPSCMGDECNIYVGVSSGTLQKDGGTDTVDSTNPVDISDEYMLPNSKYLKADAVSCSGCNDIKPEITEKCYGPGYYYNFEIEDLEKSKSSSEKCENSIDLPKCTIPTGKAQLFVEYGVVPYDGDQQAPQSLCHCEGGSLQFFESVSGSDTVPRNAYSDDKLAKYIENDYDYELCQRVCVRDIDGNFWEGYDEVELAIVPYCGKCYTYAGVWYGILRNVDTGAQKTTSDTGADVTRDPVGPNSAYLKIVALSCGGCDKIQEIDKCNTN
uniref:Uncharacterized protein n=1 Tax=Acrobeloides nanus TaxID=290746 RepID=A0A914E954_9BILA